MYTQTPTYHHFRGYGTEFKIACAHGLCDAIRKREPGCRLELKWCEYFIATWFKIDIEELGCHGTNMPLRRAVSAL